MFVFFSTDDIFDIVCFIFPEHQQNAAIPQKSVQKVQWQRNMLGTKNYLTKRRKKRRRHSRDYDDIFSTK